jgi:hypothetical protein
MKLVGVLAVLLLTIGAAVALTGSSDDGTPSPVAIGDIRLVSVDGCDDLLEWYRTVAAQIDAGALSSYAYGGYATGGAVGMADSSGGRAAAAPGAAVPEVATTMQSSAADDGATSASGRDFSGTNVQERGVDEPDNVKTNGTLIITAGPDTLEIVDVTGDAPTLVSTTPLEQGGTELLLSGDRVLALTTVWRPEPGAEVPADAARIMIAPAGSQVTVLQSIDISDPAHPRTVASRELPGAYRTARLTGTTARVVMVSAPQLPVPGPAVQAPTEELVQQKLAQWKTEAIASMTLEDWAPIASDDCSSVARTSSPQGLGTTSVLTLDAEGALDITHTDSVVADAGTVYASPDRLYLATSRWSQATNPAGDVATELHAFDISGADTSYVASGAVPGYLLNQFALSERDGHLRVATTQEPPWSEQTPTQHTHSGIAVLDERAGALVEVGRVDGLGVTERIQAVRYVGDLAFVVTFRQMDPLYAIDLSDPTAPRVAGQLKVPGYSAYLHPIDDDHLIGVGQDATDEGQVLGTQVATFDVTDPSTLTRQDVVRVDHGSSTVEYDHRAFLWWPDARLVVVPVQIYDFAVAEPGVECPPDAACATDTTSVGVDAPPPADTPVSNVRPFAGAIVFSVGDDGSLTEVGRVQHDAHAAANTFPMVQRSLVIGDALYTLSEAGVLRSDLASLADEGFAAFPAPTYENGGTSIPVEG